MNINRNNYEEYFLLYVDNELSVAEKNAVDAFVAANPDLQEELVMLQQSVIKPGNIDFPGKDMLLKPEAIDDVTEEKLLLLLDNELDETEKQELLSVINSNKIIQQEWAILLQTKISPADTIIFIDKASLYKKEEGKVVPIKWWRVAAAAMLIGFGLWGAVSYLNNDKPGNTSTETAGVKPKAISGDKNTTGVENKTSPVQKEHAIDIADTKSSNKGETATVTSNKSLQIKATSPEPANETATQNNDQVNAAKDEEKDKEQNDPGTFNNDDSNKKVTVFVTPETQKSKIENTTIIPTAAQNALTASTPSNNDTGDKNDFVFDDDKPRKTKVGGFFKRVKRVIERKTKIKTGDDDEVRIANMSFAMH